MTKALAAPLFVLTMCPEAFAATVNHIPDLIRPAVDQQPSVEWTESASEEAGSTSIPMYLGACHEPHMMRMSGSSFYSWKNGQDEPETNVTDIFKLYCNPE